MLRRRVGFGTLSGLLLLVALVAMPSAEAQPKCQKLDPQTGMCEIWAPPEIPKGDPPNDNETGTGSETGGGDEGTKSPILNVNGQQCLYIGLADPQPAKSNPVWEGRKDGAIHECTTAPGGGGGQGGLGDGPGVSIFFWMAEAPDAPPPPDPEDLARQAVATMNLQAIDIGIVPEATPGSVGIVGMPAWMWVAGPSETTWGPNTAAASARGYTVTATAEVDKVVWNMGDGTSVTCTGAGTPYADQYGKKESPDCGHVYTRQGEYDVTATSYWTVEWNGIGETGVIPLDFSETATITIGEAQVITQ